MKYDAKAIEEMIEAYLPEETGHQTTIFEAMNYSVTSENCAGCDELCGKSRRQTAASDDAPSVL